MKTALVSLAVFTVWFGASEQLHDLTPVTLKGPEGQELILAWKSSRYVLVFGLWAQNDGYVLRKANNIGEYFPMPQPAEIERLQQSGMLPRPLPPGGMLWTDIAIGFSLWWVVALAAAGLAFSDWWKLRHCPKVPPSYDNSLHLTVEGVCIQAQDQIIGSQAHQVLNSPAGFDLSDGNIESPYSKDPILRSRWEGQIPGGGRVDRC